MSSTIYEGYRYRWGINGTLQNSSSTGDKDMGENGKGFRNDDDEKMTK